MNLKFIVFLSTVILFLSFFSGCETVKTKYVGVDSLNINYSNDSEKAIVKITGIFLTNGKFINLDEKNPEVDMKAKAILYEESENVRSIKYFTEISTVKIKIVKGSSGPDAFGLIIMVPMILLITLIILEGGKIWS